MLRSSYAPVAWLRQLHEERRALARRRLGPDASALLLEHLSRDGQTGAGSLELLHAHQAVEQLEDAIVVLHVEADAVVADRQPPSPVEARGRDAQARWVGLAAVLDGVVDQVAQDLHQPPFPGLQRGEGDVHRHLHVLLLDDQVAVAQNHLDQAAQVDRGGRRRLGVQPRVAQQVLDELVQMGGGREDLGQAEVGAVAQARAMLAIELVCIAGDAAQRRLQVVRHRVGELLQLLVPRGQLCRAGEDPLLQFLGVTLQLLVEIPDLLLRLLALGDVGTDAQDLLGSGLARRAPPCSSSRSRPVRRCGGCSR